MPVTLSPGHRPVKIQYIIEITIVTRPGVIPDLLHRAVGTMGEDVIHTRSGTGSIEDAQFFREKSRKNHPVHTKGPGPKVTDLSIVPSNGTTHRTRSSFSIT